MMIMQKFEMKPMMGFGNRALKQLLKLGIPMASLRLLSHQGRKSGNMYLTPVALVERNNKKWIVAAFGEVNWVKNIRHTGKVHLIRGHQERIYSIQELDVGDAPPILKMFLSDYRFVPFFRPYFKATYHSPTSDFIDDASQHPVFQILEEGNGR